MKNENKMGLGIVPKYAVVPLLLTVVANCIAYYGSNLIAGDLPHHKVAVALDYMIPMVPQWIIIYFGCYISWVAFYIIVARESKEICYQFVTAEIIAKLFCFVIFVCYPTQMYDRCLSDSAFWNYCISFLYSIDKPVNLFPSIHCFASWLCFRGLTWCRKVPKCFDIIAFVLAILVFLSTLFTKQHYVVDIFGGIAVAELGIFISKNLGFSRFILRKVSGEQYQGN